MKDQTSAYHDALEKTKVLQGEVDQLRGDLISARERAMAAETAMTHAHSASVVEQWKKKVRVNRGSSTYISCDAERIGKLKNVSCKNKSTSCGSRLVNVKSNSLRKEKRCKNGETNALIVNQMCKR